MPNFLPYRILSYVLLPMAFVLGIAALLALPIGLANPAMLLGVFLMITVVIYSICALRFLHSGLLRNQPLKVGLKDWIKVNAYSAIVFGIMMLLQSYLFLTRPDLLAQMSENQPGPIQMPAADFRENIQLVLYIMLIYGVLLLTHLFTTLVLVRRYDALFSRHKN